MDLLNLFDKDDGLTKEDILSRLELFAKELRASERPSSLLALHPLFSQLIHLGKQRMSIF